MIRRIALYAGVLTIAMAVGHAQTPPAPPAGAAQAGQGRAAGGGRGPATPASPVVNADKTITFHFRAPNAKTVELIGEIEGKPSYPMTRDDNGVWSVTIGPLAPDVYNYQFRVDAVNGQGGVIAMDPQNPWVKLGFGGFPPANLVEIPSGASPSFDAAKPVPHGNVSYVTYDSKAIGGPRTAWIYTPPGYERGSTKYPVFYLLHGSGNIDSSWILTGRANYIMDNLIAAGQSKPMILVMPYGYNTVGVGTGPLVLPTSAAPGRAAGAPPAPGAAPAPGGGQQNSPFAKDLLEDLLPYVEKNYRVLNTPDNRAIGGLSMGGGQTIAIGFTHPDVFHYIIVMSAGAQNADQTYPDFFKDATSTNKKVKLLWVGVGKDDALTGVAAKALDTTLTAKGIAHKFVVGEGRHEWVVWRHHLHDVAPMLFR